MVQFGRVPEPPIDPHIIDTPAGSNWNDRGPRNIVAVCVHRMLGSLSGTEQHFSSGAALTDFGIGNVNDGPELDGAIWQFNPLEGNKSPYANGWGENEDPGAVVEGHGRVFWENYYPQYDLNRDIASIETSGCSAGVGYCGGEETPVSDELFESLSWLIAYICDHYCEIPHHDFPFNTNVGPDFYAVYQHFEFAGKDCPFPAMKAEHENYVARAQEIMRHFQEGGAGTEPPVPGTGEEPGEPPTPDTFSLDDRIKSDGAALDIFAEPGTGGSSNNGSTMTPDDAIEAASRGSAEQARAYADRVGALRPDEAQRHIDEIYRLGAEVGFDAAILIAQSVHETGDWQSVWWSERLNPAGIGITGDPAENEASKYFADGIEAARAQVAHMHAYVYGDTRPLPAELEGTDPRYQAVFDAGYAGSVDTIADLATQWATDPSYAEGICNRGNQIFDLSTSASDGSSNNAAIGQLPAGEEVCVLQGPENADGQSWYRVSSSPEGWVAGTSLVLVEAGGCESAPPEPEPEPEPTPVPNPDPSYAVGDQIIVVEGPLNVRSGAGVSHGVIESLATGAHMCVLSAGTVRDGYTWFQIRTTGGSVTGWIAGEYTQLEAAGRCLTHEPPYSIGDHIRVVDGPLNVRSGPGGSYAVVTSLQTGSHMCVLSGPVSADGYIWYEIRTTGGSVTGWVASQFTRLYVADGCETTPPRVPGTYVAGDQIIVVDGPLNVRSQPGTIYTVVYDLPTGSHLCVLGGPVSADGFGWYEIQTTGGSVRGWVAGGYTELEVIGGCGSVPPPGAKYTIDDRIIVMDGPLNVRSDPGTIYTVVADLPTGSPMCVVDGPVNADGFVWYQIRTTNGSITGWVASEFTRLELAGGCA